jgi:hypothetical protein
MFHIFHHNRFELLLTHPRTALNAPDKGTAMHNWRRLLQSAGMAALRCVGLALALSQGGARAQTVPPASAAGSAQISAAGFVLPAGIFSKSASDQKPVAANMAGSPAASAGAAMPLVPSPPIVQKVLLYASPTTRAFFAKGGIDTKDNSRTWEVFLRKYRIPFQLVSSVEELEKVQPGVLLLPSTVAMSEREKKAVIDFRGKGGGVLSTWLTGVRNENGEWRGFGFMDSALDVKVVGNTEANENDNFLMPHGDSPVTHVLPAGLRVWLERVKDWYPLRLVGRNAGAQIMDWSRSVAAGRSSSTVVFDESRQSTGRLSRVVVLGYPERLWISADPKALEAIAHNALMWLLRQPDAYVAAWPYPYRSAFVFAINAPESLIDVDLNFAKLVEDAGFRATYYTLSSGVAAAAPIWKQLLARGHEIAYLGDTFVGFKDQTTAAQTVRLNAMRKELKESGLSIAADAGFQAPMDSYDKTTEKLLRQLGFGHLVSFMDASEARLPFIAPADSDASRANQLVVLPRTQNGPEDAMEDGDPDVGFKTFLQELDLAEAMGGLSLVRMTTQNSLTDVQLNEIFNFLKTRRERMWPVTAGQMSDWWRERERVSVRLSPSATAPVLEISVKDGKPLGRPATVWVNLPEAGGSLRLVARESNGKTPKVAKLDAWRSAVVLDGFTPGEYQWYLYFDGPPAGAPK